MNRQYHYKILCDSVYITNEIEDVLDKHEKEGNIVEMNEDDVLSEFRINRDADLSWWDIKEEYIDDVVDDEDVIGNIPKALLIQECKRRFKTQKEMLETWREH